MFLTLVTWMLNDYPTKCVLPIKKKSINLFIYESAPNDEKIEDILFMQIQILNLRGAFK